jgi:hypothetical protein
MSRNTYNLSHIAHLAGQIGRVQTIACIPVKAGDSIKLAIDGIIRLAPTRKEIVSECQVDICAFFVKHRHVLGDQAWINFISQGPQATANPFTGFPVAAAYRDPFYLGIKQCGATVNTALMRGYNFIIGRYFMVPNTGNNTEMALQIDQSDPTSLDYYPTTESFAPNFRKYGTRAARLPHILNGFNMLNIQGSAGQDSQFNSQDYGVVINDTAPDVGLLDIRDLAQIQGRYKTVQEKNWFAQFYSDILEKRYGTTVNADADMRPDYLGRTTQFLSGEDINGTDDATLGSYVGKTLDRVNFSMPRRAFPEHGNVWVMAVLRYPMLHTKEQHPLLATAQPDPQLLMGDAELWANEPTVQFNPSDWLAGGSVYTPVANNQQPYGQEYRYQPNRVHPNFETIPGYPFTAWDTVNAYEWYYYNNDEYKDTFQTTQIGQWQAHLKVNCSKYSTIPAGTSSIMAGA